MKFRYISDAGLSQGTINFIKALPRDKKFQDRIKTTRNILRIPIESYQENMEKAANFLGKTANYKNKIISSRMFLQFLSQKIVNDFCLPQNWESIIRQLVLFDSALVYEEEIVLDLPDLVSNPKQAPFVGIRIFGKIRRDRLDKWIDKNWDTIEKYFETMKFKKPSKVNRKHAELMIEAKELYESGKFKTVAEIYEYLNDRYVNDEELLELVSNEERVRNWIKRLITDIHH